MPDLTSAFTKSFQAVRGEVRRASTWDHAAKTILDICAAESGTTCAVAQLPRELTDALRDRAEAQDVQLLTPPYQRTDLPAAIDTAHVGVTGMDFAIAETGTLVEIAMDDATRLVSSLPNVHVAVVSTEQLIPGLHDSADRLRDVFNEHDKNCVVSFLSGPSRTGDIELRLTLGVHGPEKAYALLVDQPLIGSDHGH